MSCFQITALAEDHVSKRGLLAEHGLCFLIEVDGKNILFDTGQGLVLKNNAKQLGIDLSRMDAVALSHGHYDHTGGLAVALNAMNRPRLYAHPAAFAPKYGRNADGTSREIGMSNINKEAATKQAELIYITAPKEIEGGLYLTGPVPRATGFEDTGGAFFKDPECRLADDLPDDQAAFIETKSGTVIILGCAHSGVINTLQHIQSLTKNKPIHTIIGGMHLLQASPDRLEQTIAALRHFNIQRLIPCHCTGFAATSRLWNEFPEACEFCSAGTVLTFQTNNSKGK